MQAQRLRTVAGGNDDLVGLSRLEPRSSKPCGNQGSARDGCCGGVADDTRENAGMAKDDHRLDGRAGLQMHHLQKKRPNRDDVSEGWF